MTGRAAIVGLLAVAALVAAVAALQGGAGGRAGSGSFAPGSTVAAVVTRVVDGDTVHVRPAGSGAADETVRYIGIDTPESVKPNTPVQCYAKAASHRNADLVGGQAVRLVVGAEPRDRYGRLLAYVYRAADGLFVNDSLVADGYARPLTIPPNDRYSGEFGVRAETAQAAGRGLWGACR